MIRAVRAWLTGRRHAAEPEPPRAVYDPDADPLVRQFRLERRHAERATRRLERAATLPLESDIFPERDREDGT